MRSGKRATSPLMLTSVAASERSPAVADCRLGAVSTRPAALCWLFERPVHICIANGLAAPKKIVDRSPQYADHFRPQ